MKASSGVLNLLREHGGLREGHTSFRNGRHGNGWIEKGALFRDPGLLDAVAEQQAQHLLRHFPDAELLVGASQCGAVLASFVARRAELPVAFTTEGAAGLAFHRMHRPEPGLRTVYVDDLIATGADARAHAAFLRAAGFSFLGASAWVSGCSTLPFALATLDEAPHGLYEADACPLCARGEPLAWQDVRE